MPTVTSLVGSHSYLGLTGSGFVATHEVSIPWLSKKHKKLRQTRFLVGPSQMPVEVILGRKFIDDEKIVTWNENDPQVFNSKIRSA